MTGRRLFAKILLGFLCTFLLITQGVWALFSLRDRKSPPESAVAVMIGPTLVNMAGRAVETNGVAGFAALEENLSPEQRHRLRLVPASQEGPVPSVSTQTQLVRPVKAPGGKAYNVHFDRSLDKGWRLNIPPELLVIGFVAGMVFSALLATYLLRPIGHLRNGFARLARGELDVRVGSAMGWRRDEIADLALDFDQMAALLKQLVSRRTQFLHDVSHELRSPLARLQVALALARQGGDRQQASMDRMEREVERMNELIGELLTLSRAEGGTVGVDEYFDLFGILESVVEDVRYEAAPADVTVALRVSNGADEDLPPIRGSSELVRRAVENILRNALRFSAGGDVIEVEARWSSRNGAFTIVVRDSGPGVADDAIDTIFEPFVHGVGGGLGLGLAIASRAIAAHGGTVAGRNREPHGFEVTMVLPARD